MSFDADLQNLWRQQPAAPRPSEQELIRKAQGLKRQVRNKMLSSVLLMGGTAVVIWMILKAYHPRLLTTYAGAGLTFLALAMQLAASGELLSLVLRQKDGRDLDTRRYLELLLRIRKKQQYLQTRILSLYFILLTAGIFLSMIEYTWKMSRWETIFAYGITALWFAIAWWILRPRAIRKGSVKLNELIIALEKIQVQLDQAADEG